ncbi:MAG: AAA family ATPase [Gammaproteobacteria bacterium]|nr:AAA family ATPase [Gammaproteobacteria bacterium]
MKKSEYELSSDELYHACDMSLLDFTTTDDITEITDIIGQERALEALDFGFGIKHEGYNLFVSGSTGLGKHTIVKQLLESRVVDHKESNDWCYINNFKRQHNPLFLKLPTGTGNQLRNDMSQLVEDLLVAIPAAFESDEYHARVKEIKDEVIAQEESAFLELDEIARKQNIALIRTPSGYTLGPMRDGKVLTPEEFSILSEKEQDDIKHKIDDLENQVSAAVRKIPVWTRETRKSIKLLNREITQLTVEQFLDELISKYADLPDVIEYLNEAKNGFIEDVDAFRRFGSPEGFVSEDKDAKALFSRFQVNVLVDNSETKGLPVIYEDNPTYNNLVGRIEHLAQFGTLLTDFTLIKAGALHRANGGFLVLDMRRVLTSPFAWEGLKRSLRAHEVRIESLEKMLSVASTISLEPEPIPIDIKVVLTGDRWLYYLLKQYDPEFNQLFKVAVDFSEDITRSSENTILFAQMVARLQHESDFKSFDQQAVALIIEDCARRIEDAEKLSLHMGNLIDLLRESDYWSTQQKHDTVQRNDVQLALDARIRRLDQLRERVHEQVLRGTYLLETEGSKVAQVNALSVIQLGDYAFGRPSKVTATARLGSGKVIDIEREVDLGGSIHSKGVLILSSYMANRYAKNQPLSLSASLVFEQSYGSVEGDSASVAELCALLSALSDLPINQSIALTGSVNQHGQVQAIGGVNEKIEGFFDICKARGLTGKQAVIIPQSNIKNLMLHRDVVEAVENKKFRIYAVETVDQVMELLTGKKAGVADKKGDFPEKTVNGLVQERLSDMNRMRKNFSKSSSKDDDDNDK